MKPGESVVVYTKEHIRTPFNVFGLVTGKGKYIYQGCMIASGKIDPGPRRLGVNSVKIEDMLFAIKAAYAGGGISVITKK